MSALARLCAVTFHASALAYMFWGFHALNDMMNPITDFFAKVPSQRGGHYQYLTVQALTVSEAALAVCIISDLLPSPSAIRGVRRLLVLTATVLSFGVSLIWWPMVLLLPSLIMPANPTGPSSGEQVPAPEMFFLPLSVDLAMHLTPAVALTIHFFFAEKKYDSTWMNSYVPMIAFAFATWYASFAEWCALGNGKFAYPFLDVPLPGRLAIYASVTGIALGSFRMLNWLHQGDPFVPNLYERPGDGLQAMQDHGQPKKEE